MKLLIAIFLTASMCLVQGDGVELDERKSCNDLNGRCIPNNKGCQAGDIIRRGNCPDGEKCCTIKVRSGPGGGRKKIKNPGKKELRKTKTSKGNEGQGNGGMKIVKKLGKKLGKKEEQKTKAGGKGKPCKLMQKKCKKIGGLCVKRSADCKGIEITKGLCKGKRCKCCVEWPECPAFTCPSPETCPDVLGVTCPPPTTCPDVPSIAYPPPKTTAGPDATGLEVTSPDITSITYPTSATSFDGPPYCEIMDVDSPGWGGKCLPRINLTSHSCDFIWNNNEHTNSRPSDLCGQNKYCCVDCLAPKQTDNCANVTALNNPPKSRRECCPGELVLKQMESGCNCCGKVKPISNSTCTFNGGIFVTTHDPVYNFDYCNNTYNGTLHPEECEGENCACCIIPICSKPNVTEGKVYIDDIENALSYALRNTIPFPWYYNSKLPKKNQYRVFNPNSRAALNAFFKIILEYLKPPRYIKLHTYGIIEKTFDIINQTYINNNNTSKKLINELINVQNNNNETFFISRDLQTSARCCKPESFWRYTCGLWNILHTITHEAKAQHANTTKPSIYTPIQVVEVIYNYVIHFQGCPYCENHFSETYDQTFAKYTHEEKQNLTYNEAILWLWCTHNAVNHRYTMTYGGESKPNPGVYDPPNAWPPHPQFPSNCTDCWSSTSTDKTTTCKRLFCKHTYDFWFGKCFQTPDDYSEMTYHNFFMDKVLDHLADVYTGPYLSLHNHTWTSLSEHDFGNEK